MRRMNVVEITFDQYYRDTDTNHGLIMHFELDTHTSYFTRDTFSGNVLTLQSQMSLKISLIQKKCSISFNHHQILSLMSSNAWFLYYFFMTLLSVIIGQLNVMSINYFVPLYSLSIIQQILMSNGIIVIFQLNKVIN